MTITPNTVAIIGAGPAGLVAAKEFSERGMIPMVFEKKDSIGGVWGPGGKTWTNMKANNSCENMRFSDHAWTSFPGDFPKTSDVYAYLQGYAEAFALQKTIHLNCEVVRVQREEEKWCVEWLNAEKTLKSALFHSVVVCSGVFSHAFTPEIAGAFTGFSIHSSEYKTPEPFRGRSVAVIGGAFSGCEIAADLTGVASKVFHIFKRACWILPRYFEDVDSKKTIPFDLLYNRENHYSSLGLSQREKNKKANDNFRMFCQKQIELSKDLDPDVVDHSPFCAISDSYLPLVEEGKIAIKKGAVAGLEGRDIVLLDGSRITVDSIIYCTGYHTQIPFFDAAIQQKLKFSEESLTYPLITHKTVFHPELPNMAFVGMSRFPIFFGLMELQARWASMVFSRVVQPPTKEAMERGLCETKELRSLEMQPQFDYSYFQIGDELARQIGVIPDFDRLKQEDLKLWEKVWKGPFHCASFRLEGPGREAAVKAISEAVDRLGKRPEKVGPFYVKPQPFFA
jgi:dimethylaniline monooxygenase (N-oxide forming)